MNLTEFKPHSQLASFIDAYWDVTCKEGGTSIGKVLPDGCVDIIINLKEDFHIESENAVLKSEKAYLGGAITHFMAAKTLPETHLVGVRFKPAAFSHFYTFSSLHEVTNSFVELPKEFTPKIISLSNNISFAFDSFFYNKLIQPKRILLPVIETVKKHYGNISVNELAGKHFTTVKQLERNFKYHIGLSPKEFINIIRYKFAQQLILARHPKRTLSDIAFECGYYDHAHLSNEIKKYTGLAPTEL
ncbi:helix-turn-helix domain-containing protein [Parapedobacter tibetensis]|uniref:helix-turn-helix domain-containing protein n=1 Tax=Parapedobacter tibetensis TaxID=2972951 RepID=UPI00214D3F6E|nr:AraC family transcriptional regulator [Parapedobacter tibetensis]